MNAEQVKALVDEYEGFLRVGRVSVDEWFALDDDEKACMLCAQKRIDVERAVMGVSQDPYATAALMAELDGGEMLGQLRVRSVVDQALVRHSERGAA